MGARLGKSTQRRFLAAFQASGGSITQASRWARCARENHYAWLRDDPEYPRLFAEAEKRATQALIDEAIRRARDGVRKIVRYKGKPVGEESEYSDTLMVALLKAGDSRFRQSALAVSGPDGQPIKFTLDGFREYMKQAPHDGEK
jgi:hypothetical protein